MVEIGSLGFGPCTTIAHHPHLLPWPAVNNGRSRKAFLGMLQQSLSHAQRLIHFIAYINAWCLGRNHPPRHPLSILVWYIQRWASWHNVQSILTGLLALLANNALLYYIHDLTLIHYLTTNFLPATTYMPEERLLILLRVHTRCPLRMQKASGYIFVKVFFWVTKSKKRSVPQNGYTPL